MRAMLLASTIRWIAEWFIHHELLLVTPRRAGCRHLCDTHATVTDRVAGTPHARARLPTPGRRRNDPPRIHQLRVGRATRAGAAVTGGAPIVDIDGWLDDVQ